MKGFRPSMVFLLLIRTANFTLNLYISRLHYQINKIIVIDITSLALEV